MAIEKSKPVLLLGIDLEDVREYVSGGMSYRDRLETNTQVILQTLEYWGVSATFFTVGSVARRYPSLLRDIALAGHEIAAHGDTHTQLAKLGPNQMETDLARNLDALSVSEFGPVKGFRAPTFSLTQDTQWAYKVLADAGIEYSSSVLPGSNPLYGWPGFGRCARTMPSGVLEIPVAVHSRPLPPLPIAGGVYLRVLPFFLTRWACRRGDREGPITTYLHPYDIDTEQERFMHPDLNNNRLMNALMYWNRGQALDRLARLVKDCTVSRYCDWARNCGLGEK